MLCQIIENCRPHAKIQVLVKQDEKFGLKFDIRWSCFHPFNCSTNFACFFPEEHTLLALCVYQYYQLLRGPGVRILGLHCCHVGVQNKRKFAHLVCIKMEVNSQKKKILLFPAMATMTSHENHQLNFPRPPAPCPLSILTCTLGK